MASCITSQWSNEWTPQAKLTVTISSQTDTSAKLSWTLDVVFHGNSMSSSAQKSWTVNVAGEKWTGKTTIGGISGTKRVASGTKTISKKTSSQKISFSVSFAFNITWGGKYGGTKSADGSISVGAKTSYKVSYNANGGSGAPSAQTKWHGTNITISTVKPTRTGYTFQGWGTSASGSVVYEPGDSYSKNASDTLYAIWKANTYAVTYDANDGSGAPSAQTKTYGVDLTLSDIIPTRENYNFLGWGTSAGATTVAYAPGSIYTDNVAITLYAIWEIAYTPPKITGFTADRCSSDGTVIDEGTSVRVVFNWAVDTVYSSGVTSIIIGYKLSTAEIYTEVPVTATGMSGSVSQIIGDGAIDTEYEYNIRVTVMDDKGSSYSDQTVATLAYIMDFLAGGGGVAFGRPAYRPGMDVAYPAHFGNNVYDKFETPISNGCANIAGDILDPDTTLESVIMTNVKTPSGGYMYIQTMFHAEKSITANRAQFALPYDNEGPMYHRYYYGGVWSAWRKHIDETELNSNLTQLPKIEVPVTINSTYVTEYIAICYYYPALHACYFRARFTRKTTMDAGEEGVGYILGNIPEEYVDKFLTPLSVYAAQSNYKAALYAYISVDGDITLRMINTTNPSYFYLGGFWIVG